MGSIEKVLWLVILFWVLKLKSILGSVIIMHGIVLSSASISSIYAPAKCNRSYLFPFWSSVGGKSMERHFKACICIDSWWKPIVHNENTKRSQVWCTPCCIWFFVASPLLLIFLAFTAKSRKSLDYCSPKLENWVPVLEVSLSSQGAGQSSRWLLRISGMEFL